MPEDGPPRADPTQQDESCSSPSLGPWVQAPFRRTSNEAQPLTQEWDLADALMDALAARLPPCSPAAADRSAMMEQLRSDAARALLASTSPETALRAVRLLTMCGQQVAPSTTGRHTSSVHLSQAAALTSGTLSELVGSARRAVSADHGWLHQELQSLCGTRTSQAAQTAFQMACESPSNECTEPSTADAGPSECHATAAQGHQAPQLAALYGLYGRGGVSSEGPWPAQNVILIDEEASLLGKPGADASPPRGAVQHLRRRKQPLSRRHARLSVETARGCNGNAKTSPSQQASDCSPIISDHSCSLSEEVAMKRAAKQSPMKKKKLGTRKRTSVQSSSHFRGVSRHRLTQRWEASLWLSGKQLYLGGFESEEDAAKAYDIAALASKGDGVPSNFSVSSYRRELAQLRGASKEEIVAYVRRRSSAFSRGRSAFRGVSGQDGRWEARIGSFGGKKNVSFGIFETEEQAARQYDRALVIEKGRSAKTNFPLADYEREIEKYKALLIERCTGLEDGNAKAVADAFQLPLELNLPDGRIAPPTLPDKSKGGRPRNSSAALIFAETLRGALT